MQIGKALSALADLYESAVRPMEEFYRYNDLGLPPITGLSPCQLSSEAPPSLL